MRPAEPSLRVLLQPHRPDLRSLRFYDRGDHALCAVELSFGDHVVDGRCLGSSVNGGRAELASRAVADAVRQAMGPHLDVHVEAATVIPMGAMTVVTAVVMAESLVGRPVAGAAVVFGDPAVTAARATLAALNRSFDRHQAALLQVGPAISHAV